VAEALRCLGQGAQPWLGHRLGELAMPVLLMAGKNDPKYLDLARDMAARIPRVVRAEMPGAGHSVVGERPAEVAAALAAWLAE
jgi:pimeloyl-ACP methyl ester carboxylesterase